MTSVLHIITDSHPFGGAQRNTWLSVNESAPEFQQNIACGKGDEFPALCKKSNIPFYRIDGLTNSFAPLSDLMAIYHIWKLIREKKFDIVHLHSSKAGILGRIAAKLAGVPLVIFTIHGVSFDFELRPKGAPILLFLEKFVVRFTDGIISVAKNCKDDFVKKGVCSSDKIRVIYSAIEFEPIDNAKGGDEKRAELGISPDEFVIGAVGHFRKAKGYEYLVESAPIVLEKYPDTRFVIVGDGPEKPDIERRIKEANLEDKFVLTGNRNDVPDLLKIMDIFCRPSIHEGLGRALTEAMYAELPPVVTDIWGTREICEEGKTGILVPIRDPEALAGGIIKLRENPNLATRIGKNAREKVRGMFAVETMVRGIEDYYRELMRKDNN